MIIDDTFGPVTIHDGARIESTAVLIGPCRVNDGAYIGHYAVIGSPAQHHGHYPDGEHHKPKGVIVGIKAVVREHCQVQQGVKRITYIEPGAYIMCGSHISHDTIIGMNATIGTNSILGGFTHVMNDVTFGQKVVTHPWLIIGAHCMVGQGACVIRDTEPYQKIAGNPARLLGRNTGAGGEKAEWDWYTVPQRASDDWKLAMMRRDGERNR